MLIIQ